MSLICRYEHFLRILLVKICVNMRIVSRDKHKYLRSCSKTWLLVTANWCTIVSGCHGAGAREKAAPLIGSSQESKTIRKRQLSLMRPLLHVAMTAQAQVRCQSRDAKRLSVAVQVLYSCIENFSTNILIDKVSIWYFGLNLDGFPGKNIIYNRTLSGSLILSSTWCIPSYDTLIQYIIYSVPYAEADL